MNHYKSTVYIYGNMFVPILHPNYLKPWRLVVNPITFSS